MQSWQAVVSRRFEVHSSDHKIVRWVVDLKPFNERSPYI